MRNKHVVAGLVLAGVLWALLPSCKRQEAAPPAAGPTEQGASSMSMKITSTAFAAGAVIPTRYTGDGSNISPPLQWSSVPAGTAELALICDDPDAPGAEPWVHWVLYKIPSSAAGLEENIPTAERLTSPAGALQGISSAQTLGYHGPRPPRGHGVHHYRFHLYALDAALPLQPGLTKNQLLEAIKGHVLAEAELVGTYQR
jgi:Raf kinase inhibitor-like YbhB/YbcL family protein